MRRTGGNDMMHRLGIVLWVCLLVLLPACQQQRFPGPPVPAVVLDIGHFVESPGARTPGRINGRYITECEFWYEYSYYTKRVIEAAGYRCVICNRGNKPEKEPCRSYAERAGVLHLCHPDEHGRRYPSRYFPDRVACGIISADFAVYRKAPAVVFLHHNSTSRYWRRNATKSIILANRHNGLPLAQSIADSLNSRVLNQGMPNRGTRCTVQTRYTDASRGGGWLNVCDDAGIPAAVVEAAFLNNRQHARYLADPANARRYAEAVGHGVVNYLRRRSGVLHRRRNLNEPDEGSFGYARESRCIEVPGAKCLL